MAVGKAIRQQTFRRIQLGDQIANRMQDQIQNVSTFLESVPYLDGTLIEGVTIDAFPTKNVEHQLGRDYRGWITLRTQAKPRLQVVVELDNTITGTGGANSNIVFDDVLVDTESVYSTTTGEITLPRAGYFDVNTVITLDDDGVAAPIRYTLTFDHINATIVDNPGAVDQVISQYTETTVNAIRMNGSTMVKSNVGLAFRMRASADKNFRVVASGSTRMECTEIGEAIAHEDTTATVDKSLFLPMIAGRQCEVDLWVF